MSGTRGTSEVSVEFDGPDDGPNANPIFITNPIRSDVPKTMTPSRIIRTLTPIYPGFNRLDQAATMCTDILTGFAPTYQALVAEYTEINKSLSKYKPEDREKIIAFLEKPRTHDKGLIKELRNLIPGVTDNLPELLAPILLNQFGRGEEGLVKNMINLDDNESFFSRCNFLGFGTHLRAEMKHIIINALFYENIKININNTDISITLDTPNGKKLTLVEAHVDTKTNKITINIGKDVTPENKDLAIKHMLTFVASHTQQNNSNVFRPKFGSNFYENLRLLSLAVGEYKLHIPRECLASQDEKIRAQIAAIENAAERQQATAYWDKWSGLCDIYSEKISPKGVIALNKRAQNPRPTYTFGPNKDKPMSHKDILVTLATDANTIKYPPATPKKSPTPV